MITKGLTLGKFAPFHKGHQHVVKTALDECHEVVVVVYDEPEKTPVPLNVRAQWIRDTFNSPRLTVIEGWASPNDEGYTTEVMQLQEDYIRSFGISGVTHFYSSEDYGAHMAKSLGAVDRRVDQERLTVPLSGTQLREDPNRICLDTVSEPVHRSYIATVCFLGAPSTGKSTIAAKMAKLYDTEWLPEYGREYWAANQQNHRLTWGDLDNIQRGHQKLFHDAVLRSNKYLFVDTNEVTTYLFGAYYHIGDNSPNPFSQRVTERAKEAAHMYDKIFVCADDFPHDDTEDRSGDVARRKMQRMNLDYLKTLRVPYEFIYGSLDNRIKQVQDSLATFDKWQARS